MSERYPLLMDTCHLAPKESDHTLYKKLGCSPCCIGLPNSSCSCTLDKNNKDNSPTHVFPDSPVSLPSKDLCDKLDQDLMKELDRDSSPDNPHASTSAQEHLERKLDQDQLNDSLKQHSMRHSAKQSQYIFDQKSDQNLSHDSLTEHSKGGFVKRTQELFEQQDMSNSNFTEHSKGRSTKWNQELFEQTSDEDISNDSLSHSSKGYSTEQSQDVLEQKSDEDMSNDSLTYSSKGYCTEQSQDLLDQKSYRDLPMDSLNQGSNGSFPKQSQDLFDYLTSADFPCGSKSFPVTSRKVDRSLGNSSAGGASIDSPCCSTAFQEHATKSDEELLKEFEIDSCSINLFRCNLFPGEHPKKSDDDLRRENGISECYVPVSPLTQSIANHWTRSQLMLPYRVHYCRDYVAHVIRIGYNKYRHKKKVNWERVYDEHLKDPHSALNCDRFIKQARKSVTVYLKEQELFESKRRRAKLIKQKETAMKQKKRVYYAEDCYILVDRNEDSDLYRKAMQNMKRCKVVCRVFNT